MRLMQIKNRSVLLILLIGFSVHPLFSASGIPADDELTFEETIPSDSVRFPSAPIVQKNTKESEIALRSPPPSPNKFSNASSSILSSLVVTFSAGGALENGGQTRTFFLTPAIEKTYTANNSTKGVALVELFIGLEKFLNYCVQNQMGISFAGASKATLSGNIWDDANSEFNNFTYNYKVGHAYIGLKDKILWVNKDNFVFPWISGSIGVGFNQASQFNNTPTIFPAIVNPDFTSNNTTAFSFTLGVGVQKAITRCWQVGLGYEFSDWGKSQLGRAPGQTLNSGIPQNNLYTNGLLLNITYHEPKS